MQGVYQKFNSKAAQEMKSRTEHASNSQQKKHSSQRVVAYHQTPHLINSYTVNQHMVENTKMVTSSTMLGVQESSNGRQINTIMRGGAREHNNPFAAAAATSRQDSP